MELGRGLSLLVGGARSGKSDLAVQLGEAWPDQVTFVATATAGDDDMTKRISRHQDERPAGWTLIESPDFSAIHAEALAVDDLVIIDCITLLVSNLMFADNDEMAIDRHVTELGQVLASRTAPTLVISNEVGLGIHPETELGRIYRDTLGRANRSLAAVAETSVFVVAGKALPLRDLTISWSGAVHQGNGP